MSRASCVRETGGERLAAVIGRRRFFRPAMSASRSCGSGLTPGSGVVSPGRAGRRSFNRRSPTTRGGKYRQQTPSDNDPDTTLRTATRAREMRASSPPRPSCTGDRRLGPRPLRRSPVEASATGETYVSTHEHVRWDICHGTHTPPSVEAGSLSSAEWSCSAAGAGAQFPQVGLLPLAWNRVAAPPAVGTS